jgi:acetylornithine deacetylase/succinyl-diaminopimelate desuccinylase-like protein
MLECAFDTHEAASLLSQLVRIDSVNPWLIPGGAGEAEVARYVAEYMRELALEVHVDEVLPGRPNVVGILRGTGGGRTLCINAHTDTVGAGGWEERAFSPRIDGDWLYGLGSADDKGQIVAGLLAARAIIDSGTELRGDLIVAGTIDEEGMSAGTLDLVERYKMDAAIVGEMTGKCHVLVTHQGFAWIEITTRGKAAHGSDAQEGIDAIAHMAAVIEGLYELDRQGFASNPHPLNGKVAFHASTIQGGTDYATYPDRCVLGIEIGTNPGETLEDRQDEIEALFRNLSIDLPGFKAETKLVLYREPFVSQGAESLLACLDAACVEVTECGVEQVGENAWMDSGLMQAAGIPTVVCGAAGAKAHAPDEKVSLTAVVDMAAIYARTAIDFCS